MSEAPERPDRPLLPPAFWALVAFVGVARPCLAGNLDPALLAGASLGLLAVAALACLALARTRLRAAVTLAAAVGMGAGLSGIACAGELARQGALVQALSASPVSSWEFRVETDMSEGASGWRCRARALGDGRATGSVWLIAESPLELGDTLRCVGRFAPNEGDEWGRSSRAQGLAGTVRVVRVLGVEGAGGVRGAVLGLRAAVLASLDAESSDARALVAGAICASTRAMSARGLDELFSACGVSHLVAVSGGHLVLVGGIVSALLGALSLGPRTRSAALVAATGAFVAFCGAPVSALRSWVMVLSAELARLVGRRAHPLSSASVTALALAALEPGVTGQLGYLLSVTCVCGLCILGRYARYALRVLAGAGRGRHEGPVAVLLASRAGRSIEEALALTLVAQAMTAPLTCATFGTLSLVAPLANVVLAPLFSALLALGLAAACLAGVPAAQAVALAGCDGVGLVIIQLARGLAGLPLSCVAVSVDEGTALAVLAVCLGVLLALWPRVSRRALAAGLGILVGAALVWVLRWRLFAPACVRVLDVGQGDAILLTDGPSAILVDTGPGDAVLAACARNNVTHLDAVVLTHLHADHAGGLEALLGTVDVGELIVGEGVDATRLAPGVPVTEVGYGDVLRAGGFALRVVSPLEPTTGEGNEGSLELLVRYGEDGRELTALLAADAEREETGAAVERGDVGDVDLLKVGHHGSAASLTPEIAEALDAEVSVASAGEGNSYGHPDPACVEILEEAGSLFLCTKDVGDVTVEPGAEGPVVRCQLGSSRDFWVF